MAASRVRQGVALLLLLTLQLAVSPVHAASPAPSGLPSPIGASPAGSPVASPTPRPSPTPLPLPSLDPVEPLAPTAPALTREVVAYLPYWVALHQDLPWDPDAEPWITDGRLTDLVLFSVGIARNGSLRLDEPGAQWILGPDAARVISAAHERGIRVLVSFTSFGRDRNERLMGSDEAIDQFAREAAQLVAARGLDGADLDVEQLPSDRFSGFGRMVRALSRALRADDPDARVMAATNGNRSGARMASLAIRRGADRVFLMGYSYRGPTSSLTGSIAPLVRTDGGLSLRQPRAVRGTRGPVRPDRRGPARLRHDLGHPWSRAARSSGAGERVGPGRHDAVPRGGPEQRRHRRDLRHRPSRGVRAPDLVPAGPRLVVPDLLRHAGHPPGQVPPRPRGGAGRCGHVDAGLRLGRPWLPGARR
ncbi:MAG: glycosyl hydrolase family 18 protein [Chloroflexota bacterium]